MVHVVTGRIIQILSHVITIYFSKPFRLLAGCLLWIRYLALTTGLTFFAPFAILEQSNRARLAGCQTNGVAVSAQITFVTRRRTRVACRLSFFARFTTSQDRIVRPTKKSYKWKEWTCKAEEVWVLLKLYNTCNNQHLPNGHLSHPKPKRPAPQAWQLTLPVFFVYVPALQCWQIEG